MKPLRILIVDDHPLNLKLLRAQLEAEGHVILSASNGVEALAVLELEAIDAIVSDILMPVMDGYRLCYEVRHDDRFRALPFIAYTSSYISDSDEKLSLDLGADCYLRKPASVQDLVQCIGEALANPGRRPVIDIDTTDVLKEYSERLVDKLEERNVRLAEVAEQMKLQATALRTAVAIGKHSEEQLRDTIDQLRDLLDHSPAVIYSLSVEGETITPGLASNNIERLLGFPAAETVLPGWWAAHVHPDDRTRANARVPEALVRGVSRAQYRLRHQDGTYRWVDDTLRLVRVSAGGRSDLAGVWTDVTDQRRAEDELQESEERYRLLFDRNPHPSWVYDQETLCFLAVNESAVQHYGYPRDEFLAMTIKDIRPPEETDHLLKVVDEEGESVTPRVYGVFTHCKKDGSRIDVEIASSAITFDGRPAGLVLANDVTERRRMEQQSLRAGRLESLGTLAGGIAHDLNNLLMPILMGVTLLKRLGPDARAVKTIDNIESSVKRGTDLVKRVLLFARGTEGERDVVNLVPLVAEVEAFADSSFPKNITFATKMADGLDDVIGDQTQLTQVLLNLCVNARDAMPGGGRLTISGSNQEIDEQSAARQGGTAGHYVVLDVSDQGTGISASVMERMFEPFFTTKGVGKGTGLGLSTVQGVLRSHGGFIEVFSEVGSGTTFRVSLPAHAHVAVPAAEQAEPDSLPRGHGELILVVDDEPPILSITRQTLEAFGYAVISAGNGAEALRIYGRNITHVAAVLTDIMMPVMDGVVLITELRRLNPDVRIVAMSGLTGDDAIPGMATGAATTFLAKPYSAEVLLRTLAEVLALPLGRTTA